GRDTRGDPWRRQRDAKAEEHERCEAQQHLVYPRGAQILSRHSGELRDRDLRLGYIGVPALLPLEAVEPAVPDFHERLDLAAHRDLARAGQHVAPPTRA